MAYFQTPTPVQIDQIDLSQIQNNNLRAQALRMQNADEQRKQNALAQYKTAVESGQSPDQAANAIRAIAPDMADRLSQNQLQIRSSQAALANDMDKFIQTRVPMAKDQAGWDAVLGEASGRYGITIPDSLKTYSPQLQQQLLMGGLSAAQRIALDRTDNTLKAQGYAPGQDPGTLHTLNTMGQEKLMFPLRVEQVKTGIANTQSEMQKREELFPIQKQNLESEITARADRRKVVMMPDPNDQLGMKKVPGVLVPGQNGEPDTIMPLQVAPESMGGQPGGQAPTYGPVPSQGQQQQPQYKSVDDVKAAFSAGKITREQAAQILRAAGWAR